MPHLNVMRAEASPVFLTNTFTGRIGVVKDRHGREFAGRSEPEIVDALKQDFVIGCQCPVILELCGDAVAVFSKKNIVDGENVSAGGFSEFGEKV